MQSDKDTGCTCLDETTRECDVHKEEPWIQNRDQSSLIMFLETCIVDKWGRVNTKHMNSEDMEQAFIWNEASFIGFGRICAADCTKNGASWVTFSDSAWEAAHRERRARGDRVIAKRRYMTTAEKRDG